MVRPGACTIVAFNLCTLISLCSLHRRDDHDYGPNDSDGLEEGKEESLRAFQDVFANPSYGTPGHPGIHTTFGYGNDVSYSRFSTL